MAFRERNPNALGPIYNTDQTWHNEKKDYKAAGRPLPVNSKENSTPIRRVQNDGILYQSSLQQQQTASRVFKNVNPNGAVFDKGTYESTGTRDNERLMNMTSKLSSLSFRGNKDSKEEIKWKDAKKYSSGFRLSPVSHASTKSKHQYSNCQFRLLCISRFSSPKIE